MSLSQSAWLQIKSISADELCHALSQDGRVQDERSGADLLFYKSNSKRITVHYHPGKTYGPKLLKALLDKIGWREADLRRLKLVK
jgi:predicted RNA binding protein YcfA (HicA-like mRNA interferase family)